MKKEIRVSICGDIIFEATKREEQLIEKIHNASLEDDDYEDYDRLMNKLNDLLLDRIYKMEGIDDVEILDTNWE